MGYFSEMALNKQEELGLPAEQVSAGNAFEDEETFDELPVPSASHSAASPTVETPPSPGGEPQARRSAGPFRLAR